MKKFFVGMALISGVLVSNIYAKQIEQTICFSSNKCSGVTIGVLGNDVKLCGGKCQGKTLGQMNKKGWKLTQVIDGLSESFGMVFTREK